MLDLTLLAANPPQSHINSFNQELLKYADVLKAQQPDNFLFQCSSM